VTSSRRPPSCRAAGRGAAGMRRPQTTSGRNMSSSGGRRRKRRPFRRQPNQQPQGAALRSSSGPIWAAGLAAGRSGGNQLACGWREKNKPQSEVAPQLEPNRRDTPSGRPQLRGRVRDRRQSSAAQTKLEFRPVDGLRSCQSPVGSCRTVSGLCSGLCVGVCRRMGQGGRAKRGRPTGRPRLAQAN